MSDTYRVFKRRPWQKVNGRWEPLGGARKSTVARGVDLETARRMCAEGNDGRIKRDREGHINPGQMFYEFEREA